MGHLRLLKSGNPQSSMGSQKDGLEALLSPSPILQRLLWEGKGRLGLLSTLAMAHLWPNPSPSSIHFETAEGSFQRTLLAAPTLNPQGQGLGAGGGPFLGAQGRGFPHGLQEPGLCQHCFLEALRTQSTWNGCRLTKDKKLVSSCASIETQVCVACDGRTLCRILGVA